MSDQTESYTRIHGRWLFSARLAWIAVATLAMIVYITAAPVAFRQLRSGCDFKPCGSTSQITPETGNGQQEHLGQSQKFDPWYHTILEAMLRLITMGVALLIFWRRSDDWTAYIASIMLVSSFAIFSPSPLMLATVEPLWKWPLEFLRVNALASAVGLFYLFPDGRFVPRWTRWLAVAFLLSIGILALTGIPFQSGLPLFVLALASGVGIQIYRYRRVSTTLQRQQTKWVVLGIAAMLVLMVVFLIFSLLNPSLNPVKNPGPIPPQGAFLFSMMITFCVVVPLCFLPVTLAFSMLRYRLWDVDIVISRTLVYGTLTAGIVGSYILIVGGLGALLQTQNNLASIVIAILLIVFLFQPLRRRLQDIANHFVPVPKAIIRESLPTPVAQTKQERKVAAVGGAPNTILRGRWLTFGRLAWALVFTVLTAMYALGFLAVRDVLSKVCEEEPCTLGQKIRHTDAGEQIVRSAGPTVGYADPLRPDEVQALETLGFTLDQYGWLGALQLGLPALVFLLIAAGLFWRKSDDWMVLFVSIMIATFPTHNTPLLFTLASRQPAWEWVSNSVGVVALSCLLIFPLLFPNGQFVPRWTRWLAIYDVAGAFIGSFLGSTILQVFGDVFGVALIGIIVLLPFFGIGVYAQLYRYFRVAHPAERQQFKWVVVGLVGAVIIQFAVSIPLDTLLSSPAFSADPARALVLSTIPDILWQMSILLIPVCITISVLRYRLWDIDILISRTLVYGALSAGIVITYILLVGLLGALFNTHVILAASFLTAALTVPFFHPLRFRLQHVVDRVTFGGRQLPSPIQEIEEVQSEPNVPFRQHWTAWLLFDLTCLLSTISIVILARNWATPVPDIWGFRGQAAVLALAFGGIGLLLARRHLQNPIGWLLLTAGLISAIVEFCIEYATYVLLTEPGALPYGTLVAWIASWIWVTAIGMLLYSFLLFPTGHLPSERWRPIAWLIVVGFTLTSWSFMIRPGPLHFASYLNNPFAAQAAYRVLSPLQFANAGAILLIGFSVILRLRKAQGVERQQLKWFAYTATLMTIIGMSYSLADAAGIGINPAFYQYLTIAIWVAISFAIAFAILRYRLWDIDVLINRTLVYGALTVGIIVLYIVLVGALSLLSQTTGNFLISLLATGLIAFLFQPLRERLQRGVNRLVYGERDDPYAALSRLGRRLEVSLAPEAVLPTVVTTVRDVLKLPYVAIYLQQDSHGYKIVAESASPSLHIENGRIRVPGMNREGRCIPLIHQGETLGYIVLGPRAPNEAFNSTDLRLLEDLAPQVGVAVHAVRLTADLQRSRERLVLAREEERRRLRRDLHDDLGPTLASFGLAASTVADLIPQNPTAATKLIKELESQMRATVGNIRRLVYDLRPPTLDELGLLPAVRERAARFSNAPNGFRVMVDAPVELPVLPAAVEVAAYRIVQEALENVSKHSQARHCVIRFMNHNGLKIEITDDGIGLPSNITPGVGLRSMRERAEELGGSCVIERCADGGTRILAYLPMGEFDGTFAHPDRG